MIDKPFNTLTVIFFCVSLIVTSGFAELQWYGDPEKGRDIFNNLNFEGPIKHSPGTGTILPAMDPVHGKIWRVHKPATDKRAEIRGAAGWSYHQGKGGIMKQGVPYYIAWRYKFKMPDKKTGSWACFQWKSYPGQSKVSNQNYPLHMTYNGRELALTKSGPDWQKTRKGVVKVWKHPVTIGTWVDVVLVINPSRDEKIGYFELYFNGKQQTFTDGSTRIYHKTMDGMEVAPKWGTYNRGAIGTDITVDLADLRIGTDLESVMPKPISGRTKPVVIDFEKEFDSLSKMKWTEVFSDDGSGNWQDKWIQDGKKGIIKNTTMGMDYSSGNDSTDYDHVVLWTKDIFQGDLRIEYDFTRLDNNDRNVCILYVQATGVGTEAFPTDIMEWADYRIMPKMSYYFKNMNALHISYAVNNDGYIRARRYPILPNKSWNDTEAAPLYSGQGYFETNETYHLTVIKKSSLLMLEVKGSEKRKLFGWDASDFAPITEGRVGLRQMYRRRSLYSNIKISLLLKPCCTNNHISLKF